MTAETTHPVPDAHGTNLFDTDPGLRTLLPLYLEPALLQHLLPHLRRLGGLAGGVLDTLAHSADKHPPELDTAPVPGWICSASSSTRTMWRWSASPSPTSAWPRCRTAAACSAGPSRCRRRRSTR